MVDFPNISTVEYFHYEYFNGLKITRYMVCYAPVLPKYVMPLFFPSMLCPCSSQVCYATVLPKYVMPLFLPSVLCRCSSQVLYFLNRFRPRIVFALE